MPEPTSSSSTSAGVASAAVHRRDVRDVRRERAQARLDRLLVADVREHAIGTPAAAIRPRRECAARPAPSSRSSPAVFSATVLPPVFGPVTSRTVAGGITLIVTGTGVLERADAAPPAARTRRRVDSAGSMPSIDSEKRARALQDVELGRRLDRPVHVGRARGGTRRSAPAGCGATSSASCSSSATMSLLISTVLSGSRNRLAPLVDAPWTMPGNRRRGARPSRART